MRRTILLVIASALVVVSACARRAPLDVMAMSGPCDSVPPAVPAGALRRARVPQAAFADGSAALVGTVVEAGTGQALWYAEAALTPAVAAGAAPAPARADSLGGFAFVGVTPGAYTLHLRALSHHYEERRVEVRAGSVDTVRAELRYFACSGY